MYANSKVRCPSHFFYADDLLIFCRATQSNLHTLTRVFEDYGAISGQIVNWSKSYIYFGRHVSSQRLQLLTSISGMQHGSLPFHYLGVPLFHGAHKTCWLQNLADKVLSRFDTWTGKLLSMAGRMALVNSVIYGSFIHSFMIYKWPVMLLKRMEKAIHNFIWSGSINVKNLVTPKWDVCCTPKEEGGLGLKWLSTLNPAMLCKLAWKVHCDPSFVFNFLHSRFLNSALMARISHIYSSVWSSIKQSFKDIHNNS